MSGELYGLQMRIKETAPQAVFIQCLTHRLDSVLQQNLTKNISKMSDIFCRFKWNSNFFPPILQTI